MNEAETEPEPDSGAGVQQPRFSVEIAAHGEQVVPWKQQQRGGSREDRLVREVTVSLPPMISDYEPRLNSLVATEADRALTAITRLDASHGEHLTSLSALLLRAESVASSKIEHVEASVEDFARASHGTKSNASATSMVASTRALHSLITSVDHHELITTDNILSAHRILMADDLDEAAYAGRLRDMQNWIGGSDHSPREALFVPPPAETVHGYLTDLLEFANRDDVPALAQAAIAHAQFESIHPFTDGNGRIGRALINTILRRRGATSRVVVPLASALVAKRETYFEVLAAYREGDAGPIIRAFAHAARTSARESETSARRLAEMPQQWIDMHVEHTGRLPRAGSAAKKILDQLPSTPFFTAEEIEDTIGGATSSIYNAIEILAEATILRPLTNRKRNQVWCASTIIDELEDLGMRVARQTSRDVFWQEIYSQVSANLLRQNQDRMAQLSATLSQVVLSTAMQEAIAAARDSELVRARLLSSIRIPEIVRLNLDKLEISNTLREAIESTRSIDSFRKALGDNAATLEQFQGSLKQWSALSDSLVRSTRLPESVLRSLDVFSVQAEQGATGDTRGDVELLSLDANDDEAEVDEPTA